MRRCPRARLRSLLSGGRRRRTRFGYAYLLFRSCCHKCQRERPGSQTSLQGVSTVDFGTSSVLACHCSFCQLYEVCKSTLFHSTTQYNFLSTSSTRNFAKPHPSLIIRSSDPRLAVIRWLHHPIRIADFAEDGSACAGSGWGCCIWWKCVGYRVDIYSELWFDFAARARGVSGSSGGRVVKILCMLIELGTENSGDCDI